MNPISKFSTAIPPFDEYIKKFVYPFNMARQLGEKLKPKVQPTDDTALEDKEEMDKMISKDDISSIRKRAIMYVFN